jgi:hypothetical protein
LNLKAGKTALIFTEKMIEVNKPKEKSKKEKKEEGLETRGRKTDHEKRYANVGRDSVINEKTIRLLEEAFIRSYTDLEACLFAGIGKTAFYKYKKENKDFAERIEVLKKHVLLTAKQNIVDKIEVGDTDTSKWYLERKNKDEFSTRIESINTNLDFEMKDEDDKILKESAKKLFNLKE